MELRSAIQIANERVSITDALDMVGASVGQYAAASMKLYCPFGHVFHQDGGAERAMRVYTDTNSAYCFAGCGYFSPVKLVSMFREISEEQAAEALLIETNYVAPDYESVWDDLMNSKPTVDTASLAEALKVACSRMDPRWDETQFEEPLSGKLTQCLGLLPKVHTQEDATKWMAITKEVMRSAIGEKR